MPESPPVRVAAIGLGWVTTHRHIPALKRCQRARLVGVIDHRPDRAESTAHRLRLRFSASEGSAPHIPWLSEIDAVTIGTPPQSHHSLVRSYLQAGKHVLVEKPMAMTVAEAEELANLADEQGLVLAVVHNFQFARSVRRLKSLIATGRLGEIRSIWAAQLSNPKRRLPLWYEELPLGLFYDESPHFFYLLRAITECELQFRSISVIRAEEGTATPIKITALLDARGIPVQIDMNFQAPLSEWHIGVLGTRGAAFVDIFRDILVTVPNDGEHLGRNILRTSAVAGWGHLVGTAESGVLLAARRLSYGNDDVVMNFCRACQGDSGTLSGISAVDGVAVVQMQHRIIESAT